MGSEPLHAGAAVAGLRVSALEVQAVWARFAPCNSPREHASDLRRVVFAGDQAQVIASVPQVVTGDAGTPDWQDWRQREACLAVVCCRRWERIDRRVVSTCWALRGDVRKW